MRGADDRVALGDARQSFEVLAPAPTRAVSHGACQRLTRIKLTPRFYERMIIRRPRLMGVTTPLPACSRWVDDGHVTQIVTAQLPPGPEAGNCLPCSTSSFAMSSSSLSRSRC